MSVRNMMDAVADGVNAKDLIRVVVRRAVEVNAAGLDVKALAALSNGNAFAEAYAANYNGWRSASAIGAAVEAYVANPQALQQIFEIAFRAIESE